MDYTNDPDCKLPLALIVNMPELKVKTALYITMIMTFLTVSFLLDQPFFFNLFYLQCVPVLCFIIFIVQNKRTQHSLVMLGRHLINTHSLPEDSIDFLTIINSTDLIVWHRTLWKLMRHETLSLSNLTDASSSIFKHLPFEKNIQEFKRKYAMLHNVTANQHHTVSYEVLIHRGFSTQTHNVRP